MLMQHTAVFRTGLIARAVIALLVCNLAIYSRQSVAQEKPKNGPIRAWVKQRLLKSEQDQPAPQASTDTSAWIEKPGDYTFSILHDGLTRLYRMHVPEGYVATNPAALLLAFHGGGGDMNYQATDKYYGLIAKSDATQTIVIFPNGYSQFKSGRFATWNAGACCGEARDQNVDDVGFVRKVIANASTQLNIDRARIYATGMSNGAMMAYRLACEMPDTFSAIAAVAGTDNTLSCAPGKPVSILHIHARNDDHVLYNGGAGPKSSDVAKITHYTSVPATIAKWVKRNSCDPAAQRVLEVPGAFCEKYAPCAGNVALQLCVTDEGGHSWPGGSKVRGSAPTSQAISANDVMWDFFNASAEKNPAAKP
jgi:polyhydroxybutyrate depolymerase